MDFGEADRVLTFLTPSSGLVGVMARGARSSRRRFGGALEPFAVTDIEFARGRGELGRLQQAQIARAFPGILGDLSRMRSAGAALDVARGLSAPEAGDTAAFDVTLAMLEALDAADEPMAARVGVGYRVRLLSVCGFAPSLEVCGLCGRRPGPQQPAGFDPHSGHLVCRSCGGGSQLLSARSRALIKALASPHWLSAVGADWSDDVMREVGGAVSAMAAHRTGRAGR